MTKGSCLCGDITWEIEGDLLLLMNCHCSLCRKAHGSAFVTYGSVAEKNFRWTAGKSLVASYESSPGVQRPFCSHCGSTVPVEMPERRRVLFPAGNMEGDLDKTIEGHVFVGSKAPWHGITDEAEQYEAFPPGYDSSGVDQEERLPATPGAIGGSCLCGAVTFEFDPPAERMGYCHCTRCRKARSAAHSAQVVVAQERFRWLKGKQDVKHFKVPGAQFFTSGFCTTCGSPTPTISAPRGIALLPAGALDQDPGIRPKGHIYVSSKAPWFDITDDLPQFEKMFDE